MNKIKNIAISGVCDFECKYCGLRNRCEEYNHKDGDPVLDQKEVRKKFADEFIMRGGR